MMFSLVWLSFAHLAGASPGLCDLSLLLFPASHGACQDSLTCWATSFTKEYLSDEVLQKL